MFKNKKSTISKKIKNEFIKYADLNDDINYFSRLNGKILRDLLISFFKTDRFFDLYRQYFIEILQNNNLSQDDYCLQEQPTPRVFDPGAHGTSLHCDYWYGHGKDTFTIWTPLSAVESGNAFMVCEEAKNESLHRLFNREHSIDDAIMDSFLKHSFPVLPGENEYAIFDSMLMHASPLNRSNNRRVSFDFRISKISDETSTKELGNYLVISNNSFSRQSHASNLKCLKYICGGLHKSTYLQHIVIENYADLNSHTIIAQEAEIERFDHPMLKQYLNGLYKRKNIDAILIASESVVDQDFRKYLENPPVKIIFCLEKKVFNTYG
jgi:hypothetical protein